MTASSRSVHSLFTSHDDNRIHELGSYQKKWCSAPRSRGTGERRSARRFSLNWPLQYRLTNAAWKGGWTNGHSVDMSARGMLLQTEEPMPAGLILEVDMEWPGLYHDKPMVRLHLLGSVTRADRRGTALRMLRCEFRYRGVPLPRPDPRTRVA